MTISGKSTKSITKADLISDKMPVIGFKKVMFAHKATAGDTLINLLALNLPSEASSKGFVQPNVSDLAAANLQVYLKNLTLISSVTGTLMPYVSYTVSGNNIVLAQAALANELFIGIIDPVSKSNNLVADTEFICASGTLLANTQDINVGKSFKVNANPNQQIGAVMVILDGQVLMRNVGNATASPSADGNYQEVPDTSNTASSLIRVNATSVVDRAYIVVSTVLSVIRPEGSLLDELERLQGLIDAITPTLADLAGVSQSTFQIAPTSQQLKQWGDRVMDMERYKVISANTTLTAKPAQNIAADTTGGTLTTLTLPASPSHGDRIMVMDARRTFGSNNLTIARNGNNIAGIADDLLLSAAGEWVELIFITSYGWSIRQ